MPLRSEICAAHVESVIMFAGMQPQGEEGGIMEYKLHATKSWTDCICRKCQCSISVKTGDKDAAERISD